ncbi:hypothetical protein CLF_102185 [Clonorchis sinensis]|uniref:ZSWIM1/3 RNaseH-like domain-containing protein n=1 Tax=Clonorchis sinensis TaxID=79923 RepID=G7Y7G0_CLOSI|nr:hypothetical protein CLF_102185 [Clonorchis sinensis]
MAARHRNGVTAERFIGTLEMDWFRLHLLTHDSALRRCRSHAERRYDGGSDIQSVGTSADTVNRVRWASLFQDSSIGKRTTERRLSTGIQSSKDASTQSPNTISTSVYRAAAASASSELRKRNLGESEGTIRWLYRPLNTDPNGMTDSASIARTPPSMAQRVVEARRPPHHVNRRLTEDELDTCRALLKYGAPSCEVRQFVADEFGKILTNQDIYNYRRKCRSSLSSRIIIYSYFLASGPSKKRKDEGHYSHICFSRWQQIALFRRFPDVLHVDGTHTTNRFGLYTFLITDGMGTGRPVIYAFVENEQFTPTRKLFDLFRERMGEHYPVKTFVMDKVATQMRAGAHVRPLLECANPVVHSGPTKDVILIERVQRAATKTVAGLMSMDHETRLAVIDLFPLEYHRLRVD